MKVILQKNPGGLKKWRAVLPDGKKVDFGLKGYSDYTIHKNPLRMRSYVMRHGGVASSNLKKSTDEKYVQDKMLNVKTSTKENWSKNGIYTPGFWSRWLLWSHPSINAAKREISKKFNVKFQPK